VREFIFQKKYMGSYCDIYLNKNISDTYFVSRNGHKIAHMDLELAIKACEQLHAKFDWTGLSMVIIQAELLPWHVLGKGLIQNEFLGYLNAHRNHLTHIENTDLYRKINTVKESAAFKEYVADKKVLSQTAVKKKYASHIVRQYDAMEKILILDLEKYKVGIDIYEQQINHFGQEIPLHFKPFNILKKVFDDGTEELPNDNLSYAAVNDDEYKTVSILSLAELDEQLKPIYQWYESLSSSMEEGIMIKPVQAFIKGLPPAFKVRNNNYLTMIYGVNFISEYEQNIYKRSIGRKLECSINDWMLNWELLKTEYRHIDKENYPFKNTVLDRILGEQIENNLDHRL
jgi:hypothetical protein